MVLTSASAGIHLFLTEIYESIFFFDIQLAFEFILIRWNMNYHTYISLACSIILRIDGMFRSTKEDPHKRFNFSNSL